MNQPQAQQQPLNPSTPEPTSPETSTVSIPAEKVVHINIDDIKPNTILVINVDVESPIQKMALGPVFAKLLAPFKDKLKEKCVTVMLMSLHENINLVSEEEMNNAGWFKKDKSLIISPFQK